MPEVYTAQLAYVILPPCFKHTQATNSCKELQKSIPEVYTAQLADAVLFTCFKHTQGTKGYKQLQKKHTRGVYSSASLCRLVHML